MAHILQAVNIFEFVGVVRHRITDANTNEVFKDTLY